MPSTQATQIELLAVAVTVLEEEDPKDSNP